MGLFDIVAILLTLSALFSYLNFRFVKLPNAIGVMLIALLASLILILLGTWGIDLEDQATQLLSSIDFDDTVLHGMLAFLLFAGSLHVNLGDLARQKWLIGWLATVGVVGSTLIVGSLMWLVLGWLGFQISYLYCLLFGALISPTDPIAVLGILRKANVPKSLEVKITGESLFNDGVGVVIFMVLFELVTGEAEVTAGHAIYLFLTETGGGVVLGFLLGYVAYRLLKSLDNYQVEVLMTLALVTGGYALARHLHLSGPIAMVVSGLLIGNHGRSFAMSEKTVEHLDTFWELTDEILNSVLFLLIGLELLVISFSSSFLTVALSALPIVLFARFISVGFPVIMLRPFREFSPGVIRVLTWGGLRGGISVALALSLPAGEERDIFISATYGIVIFSIAVQGLTIGRLVQEDRNEIRGQ